MKSLSILTLLSIFALSPLFAPGYFWGAHDARHSVYFLFEFNRSMADGILFPRWLPDFTFGYGYPFFNINSPLAYFIGEVFVKLGLDFVSATKLVFGLAIVTSGWAMYGFVRRSLGERAALLAGLVYVYAPYHLLDVYVRGALAETVALVFLPLCLWGFAAAIERPRMAAIVGAALAYAGLTLAHAGIALLFSLVLAAYMVVLVLAKIHRTQPLNRLTAASAVPLIGHLIHVSIAPLLGLLLGIASSAIFLLPSLLEQAFVRTDQYTTGTADRLGYYDYHNHFTYFFQLFSPQWGFGLSVPGPDDQLSLQLGAAAVVLGLLSFVVVSRSRTWRPSLLFFQGATLVLTFMMLPQSALLWEKLPLVAWAQFPWRFLALTALTLAPLAGSVLISDGRPPDNRQCLCARRKPGRRSASGTGGDEIRCARPSRRSARGAGPAGQLSVRDGRDRRTRRGSGVVRGPDALPARRRRTDRLHRLGGHDPDLGAAGRRVSIRDAAHHPGRLRHAARRCRGRLAGPLVHQR